MGKNFSKIKLLLLIPCLGGIALIIYTYIKYGMKERILSIKHYFLFGIICAVTFWTTVGIIYIVYLIINQFVDISEFLSYFNLICYIIAGYVLNICCNIIYDKVLSEVRYNPYNDKSDYNNDKLDSNNDNNV